MDKQLHDGVITVEFPDGEPPRFAALCRTNAESCSALESSPRLGGNDAQSMPLLAAIVREFLLFPR
jgi:hypothetical protein